MENKVMLSVVVPMYNESAGIALFFETIQPVLSAITESWEIVCVDDGSRDNTFLLLEEVAAREPRIRLIKLSRNFGKEIALSAGIDQAIGDAVIPIDADLQDPPELIVEMVEKWRQGYKVVLATRKTRTKAESWLKRATAWMFYHLIAKISSVVIPQNTGDFRLMDRQVVEVIKMLPERTRFMRGLFSWVGFATTTIYYHRPERKAGVTQFTSLRMWNYALDGIFSFSALPLKIWTYIGVITAGLSLVYAFYLVAHTLLYHDYVPGYASIMVAILFMGGVQLISLGVLGEYVARTYEETKQRPLYVVEKKL